MSSSFSVASASSFDLDFLLRDARLQIHFQPIVSLRRQVVLGLEALVRGVREDGTLISPLELFGAAGAQDRICELDFLCRQCAVEAFAPLHQANPQLILFLNLHPKTFAPPGRGKPEQTPAQHLEENAPTFESEFSQPGKTLDPGNVALEILELQAEDVDIMAELIESYKSNGFLMALDDLGSGYSNLDRIAAIKPDIIKADRSLLSNIQNEYHKQEVFKSMVVLAEKIGGWIVAEGVENEEEVLTAMEMGADMMQGFFFARPRAMNGDLDSNLPPGFYENIHGIGEKFKNRRLQKLADQRNAQHARLAILHEAVSALSQVTAEEFDQSLREIVKHQSEIESAHILDEQGIQVSDCIGNLADSQIQKSVIFAPPACGFDHSLKEYFYLLNETNLPHFETQPYVPRPTEHLCVTVSTRFHDASKAKRVLCIAFHLPDSAANF